MHIYIYTQSCVCMYIYIYIYIHNMCCLLSPPRVSAPSEVHAAAPGLARGGCYYNYI